MTLKKIQADVRSLRESYKKLSWYQRWFYPGSLGKALDELQDVRLESLLPVYQAFGQIYFSRTWFIRSWFFPSLETFACVGRFYTGLPVKGSSRHSLGRTELINQAYRADLLEGDLAQDIFSDLVLYDGNPEWLLNVLTIIKKANLLTQTNIAALKDHSEERAFVKVLDGLYKMGLLEGEHDQANFNMLVNYQGKSQILAKALSILQKNGLLEGEHAQANLCSLIEHYTDRTLSALIQKQVINQASFDEYTGLCQQEEIEAVTVDEQIASPVLAAEGFTTAEAPNISTKITPSQGGFFSEDNNTPPSDTNAGAANPQAFNLNRL